MDSEELIEFVRRARREETRFFSNVAKSERERWVVKEFLANLSISATEDEFKSRAQNDDVNVVFRDACFQVKEIPVYSVSARWF